MFPVFAEQLRAAARKIGTPESLETWSKDCSVETAGSHLPVSRAEQVCAGENAVRARVREEEGLPGGADDEMVPRARPTGGRR